MSVSRIIEIAGHRLSVTAGNDASDGRIPVVFLHGILGSERFWPALFPVWLSRLVRWYSVSLPGHFPSSLSPNVRSEDLEADRLTSVLAELIRRLVGTEPVCLVGWSTGGSLALQLAASMRNVRSVLSIAGFARGCWHGILGLMQKLARGGPLRRCLFRRSLKVMTAGDRRFRWALGTMSSNRQPFADAGQVQNLLGIMRADAARHDPETLRLLFAAIRNWNVTDRLRSIRVPVVIAGGDCDRIIPYRHTCEIAGLIPSARLVTFAGTGHTFFGHNLQEFHACLHSWLFEAVGLPRDAHILCGAKS